MNLGVLLSPGDSLTKQSQFGQLERLVTYYLKPYAAAFDKVFLFSYGDKNFNGILPAGVKLVTRPWPKEVINRVNVFRVFQAVGGLPAVFSGKPFVVTYGYEYPGFAFLEGKWLIALAMKLILTLVLFRAKKIIITTKDSLSLIKPWQDKAVLIPNGVDPNVFKPALPAGRPGGIRDSWLVLSVGRLVKQKNHQRLIETVAHSKYREKIKLVIIGRGPLKSDLRSLAIKLKVNLKIIDNLPHRQLVGWYQKAAIFSLTSFAEGQSKALLEAMACGCATLTTQFSGNPAGGLPETELTTELDKLISSESLRRERGVEGRNLIVKKFNLPKLVKKEINLLKSCA